MSRSLSVEESASGGVLLRKQTVNILRIMIMIMIMIVLLRKQTVRIWG